MTFLEGIVFLLGAGFLYWLMKPIQRTIESKLRKFLHARSKTKPIIDITDYQKKDKNK